ncbi:phosphopentomutase [Thomasclavelia cocleata]|uniref:Phosphopentomutase n=1 Tax=Thomasclavelia cocleata TaxID=69824 RepID=A0A1I0BBL4_9FIRM|nr:phosphopentomutase [Thomasclavelia cocleata]MCR1959945.1 phosphopentomutase [Thomasclavelia cocleata]NDO41712.1 phosphopentomutase [Thomasclavelia cocleata]SET04192.1 phosphopentomutase [Thomasclavelia cocleata]
MKYKRIFLIVCDSLGIGNAKDAKSYNDEGANTLQHICDYCDGLDLPNLEGLGLGNLGNFKGIYPLKSQLGYTLALNEISKGKDTITGHWEMMGLKTEKPFVTFTETGFPDQFIKLFEEKTGRKCVGNKAASGTEILDEYGEHQIKTGDWIVYTSADSVFQIAANEEVIPLQELYDACKIARELAMDERWKVGRIIARPYIGKKAGEFKRTANCHDLALPPFAPTVLEALKTAEYDVIGVGKIPDIFVNQGITKKVKTINNQNGMNRTIELSKTDFTGLCFVNLVDFDAVYGHRRDPKGYGKAIKEFDNQLEELMKYLNHDDLLMITSDHGNDPTYKGTDHTREQVPLLIYSKELIKPHHLEQMDSFAVIGATIADNFGVSLPLVGCSILNKII